MPDLQAICSRPEHLPDDDGGVQDIISGHITNLLSDFIYQFRLYNCIGS